MSKNIIKSLSPPALLALIVSCGPSGPEGWDDLALLRSPIIKGAIDPGHANVGRMENESTRCTTTLIGTQTLLTGAVCVTKDEKAPFSILKNKYWFGDKAYSADSVVVHPKFESKWVSPSLAVVRLTKPVNIKPVILDARAPKLGETITLVGCGRSVQNDSKTFGKRRSGVTTIENVEDVQFQFGGNNTSICWGDAGGPSFAVRQGKEVVIGIHIGLHHLTSTKCEDGGMDHRVDYLFDWINKTAKGDLFNDKTPPKVNILSPQEGASVGSTVTIDVSATDNTLISLVKVFIDGTPVFQSQKLSFSHQATDLINGTHTIRVEAVDQYKNVGSTAVQVQVTDGLVNGDQNGGQFGGQNHQPPKADDQPFVIKGSCSLGAPGPDLSLLLLCLLPLLRTMRRARRQRP